MPLRHRTLLACALLASLALAGCASAPGPVGDAEAAHAGAACEVGRVVTGFSAEGAPRCAPPDLGATPLASFACPQGRFVSGFDGDGRPLCAALGAAAVSTQPATVEISSNLTVTAIYGQRGNATDAGLWDLKVHVEMAAGAAPMDLTKLILRYSDGASTRNYNHSSAPLRDAAGPQAWFDATWIRGDGRDGVMQSGDLVEIHFNLGAADARLATRTTVELSLIPESGSPVAADFRAPATFGTSTVVTLR